MKKRNTSIETTLSKINYCEVKSSLGFYENKSSGTQDNFSVLGTDTRDTNASYDAIDRMYESLDDKCAPF